MFKNRIELSQLGAIVIPALESSSIQVRAA
jgi:hypothetical protein